MTYTTVQGDTWDIVAKKVYGDEKMADILMADNFDKLDILVFSSGTVLEVPEKTVRINDDLPPWRR